jgi:2-methylisocitrate lyase-like PEP mutase family enzyme
MSSSLEQKRARFRSLHKSGCFVIPNPWDVGSAKFLQGLGFPALASTSAGFGFTQGVPDTPDALTLDRVLQHLREIVTATDLPVNADFQSGYASDLDQLAANVKLCVDTGVAGLSIEDATGDPAAPLFDLDTAVARVRAARKAIDETGTGVVLTARAECFLTGHNNALEESISRLKAYAEAGADVLYAPGLADAQSIKAVIEAVAPHPVNILVSSDLGLSVKDIANLGTRRISVGSALARVAWTAFMKASEAIAERGEFGDFSSLHSTSEIGRKFTP